MILFTVPHGWVVGVPGFEDVLEVSPGRPLREASEMLLNKAVDAYPTLNERFGIKAKEEGLCS